MAPAKNRRAPDWMALWILFSSWSTLSGWGLSVFGWINRPAVLISVGGFLLGAWVGRVHWANQGGLTLSRCLRSRFVAPKLWLGLAALAFIGGAIHVPNNYDYLTYRFARVLSWSFHHGWYWIPTVNGRMNYSGTGCEWLMTQQFVLFHSDRLFFLINFIPYLFLPVLVFSLFTQVGIARKIAWWWMWVLPSGYCYILQAASCGNDALGAVYFLAALHYVFRVGKSGLVWDFALSCLAMALTTGVKASNLPLVLPWMVGCYFQRESILPLLKPGLLPVAVVACAVSFLPMGWLNIHFTGDFAGDPNNRGRMKISHPAAGIAGNVLQLTKDNLVFPVMPRPVDWSLLLPESVKANLLRDFPRLTLGTEELQIEEGAGIGLGVTAFLALLVVAGLRVRSRESGLIVPRSRNGVWMAGAGMAALAVYMMKMGSEATSRLVAAYYPLLVAACLVWVSVDGGVMRRLGLRWIGLLAMSSAIPLLILSPGRPLFPVEAEPAALNKTGEAVAVQSRRVEVYRVYAARADAFHPIIASIPPGEQVIGYLQDGNSPAAAVWRPFGTHGVMEVTPDDASADLRSAGIHYVLVSGDALSQLYHCDIDSLCGKWSARVVGEYRVEILVRLGFRTWYLVSL